ncbi:hypothetical protein [Rhodoferax antarcticus]|uniref:hypothetical protein n=1 Tax=Rhodoferax antarcticus TaxID=81479 RepID=UPI0012EBD863|nr:hypothetical protein [Rhodoferax antarcticus]
MTVQLCAPQAHASGIWIVNVGRTKLGLSLQSGWSLQLRGETRVIATPNDMIFVLPLLEMGRQSIYAHLQVISKEVPDIGLRVMAFPETLLLRCAFETSVSDYWPLKGIEWLDASPNLVSQLGGVLRDLQKRSWATQILKQKIKSTLKKSQMTGT